MLYWDAHPTVDDLAQSVAGAKSDVPATFANLPLTSSSDEYAERIHALGRTVPEKEQKALIAWITGTKPAHISDSNWRYLANEVMDSLCRQNRALTTWSDTLIRITRGKTNDPGLRDYAIQHLVERIQPIQLGEPFETNPKKRQTIITTLLEAAGDIREEYAGTALQSLHLILQDRQRSQQQNEPSAKHPLPLTVEQLHPIAVRLATADNATNRARTTALQVCAERGFDEILPSVREIAGASIFPDSLRISAVAALGRLGTPVDQTLLENLLRTASSRLRYAVQPALQSLKKRTAKTADTAMNGI